PTPLAVPHSTVVRGRVASSSPTSGSPSRLGGAQTTKATVPKRRRQRPSVVGRPAVTSGAVALDVRQQGELARPLDSRRQLPLLPRAHPRHPARQALAALGEEPAQAPVGSVIQHAHP